MVSVTRPAVCMQQVLSAHIVELYVKKVLTVTREKKRRRQQDAGVQENA